MAMPDEQPLSNEAVRGWLLGLQQSICDAVGAEDGTPFLTDAWERPPGGRLEGAGITRLIEGGALLERGGSDARAFQVVFAVAAGLRFLAFLLVLRAERGHADPVPRS